MAVLVLALVWTAPAFADYEQQPENFGASREAQQISPGQALAINTSGAGGVQAGSFYVDGGQSNDRVLRFAPGAEGEEPRFEEAWGWGIAEGGPNEEYVRCGPAYHNKANPADHTYEHCKPASYFPGGEKPGQFESPTSVAVDQATGDVYVRNSIFARYRKHHLIEVLTAKGELVGEGFGDSGTGTSSPPESIAEGPEKLHRSIEGAIAVDDSGAVYVLDADYAGVEHPETRVMSFEPCHAGDYESYCYATGKDVVIQVEEAFGMALVGSDRVVVASAELIREYPLGVEHPAPICRLPVSGQLFGMTANELTGEVFYSRHSDHSIRRLAPCDEATGGFHQIQSMSPEPAAKLIWALAVNPSLAWGQLRPPGVLYAIDYENATGYIFAPAEISPPEVQSGSVANATSASATLQARIDPRGSATKYTFQYLTRAQYEANEPNERQSLTVAATGGVFGASFRGAALGGTARADLLEGSTEASGVSTVSGSATVKATKGTATLHGAVGTGFVVAGSSKVAASATEGAFAVGQTIRGEGIPNGTTITTVAGSELTLSAAASKSAAGIALHAGTATLTSVSAPEGPFEVGEAISGSRIPSDATILAVTGSELTLSTAVEGPGTAVEVKAGSSTLSGVSVAEGSFVAGQPIAGVGIPSGTTIVSVSAGSLQISNPPTKPGVAVAISSSGPAPLAAGEAIEGPGIAPGTTIVALQAGKLTLSKPAEATEAGAHLRAGLAFDATAAQVREALEGLATIGAGNVAVSGGPGDGTGSSPYVVEFTGALTNQNLPELQVDGSGLTGGPATVSVATVHDGGGGFASGASEAPASPGEIPSGEAANVTTGISGLAPDTPYVFRVLASSLCDPEPGHTEEVCRASGKTVFFATYPEAPAGLPDGRAYELVSPPDKNGGEVFPADPVVSSCEGEADKAGCKPPGKSGTVVYPMQSAPGGEAVAYMGQPFSSTEGSSAYDSYISRRTASGWQTTAMSPALLATRGGEDSAYSAQLTAGVIRQVSPPQLSPQAPAGYANLYFQSAADPGSLTPLVTTTPPDREPNAFDIEYGGHSPDFSAQFFAANDALVQEATAFAPKPADPTSTGRDLYEWREGQLRLVNVLPNATVASEARFASASPDAHGVSTNGRRVFWEAGGHLYVREDGRITREIRHSGTFLSASEDGLSVLFSDGCLYSLLTEACTDLTHGKGGFQGIAGNNGDLSRIYFVDTAQLPVPVSGESQGQAGQPNLYAYQAGVGSTLIATLLPTDGSGTHADWVPAPRERTAEASPDGRYLAFASTARLTGYDNVGPCEKEEIPIGSEHKGLKLVFVDAPCVEVFLYDTVTGRLTCASCNSTGEAPRGFSTLRRINGEQPWQPQPRYLMNSGRLFFDSQDRLSPQDTNGKVEDVYEDEPAGVGSCARAAGCVLLISPGTGGVDSNFLAASEDGDDVFFTTRERLARVDKDELIDVYDAREPHSPGERVGFAAEESESQSPECQGEACQATPVPPVFATPGSATFSGLGTVFPATTTTPASAAKPTVKRHVATRAQKLSRALRACRDEHVKRKRAGCEKRALRRARGAGKIARRARGKSGDRGVRR